MEVDTETKTDQNLIARPYQNQILELALSQNVIIFLPTGAGKTYIAIMAMKEMSRPLEKPLSEGGKRIVFLVNTVALARQQFECVRSLVNLKVRLYTGDMNVDNWKREKWCVEFDQYQVFVSTAQIILDVIRHGFISITDFNLMIFDECHHAVNDHPMNQLMGHFQKQPPNMLPRVIGLTGLLLKSATPQTIEEDLTKLEAVFRGTIVTVSSYDEYQNVLIYSTKPKEITVQYLTTPPNEAIYGKTDKLVNDCIEKVKRWDIDTTFLKPTKNLCGFQNASPIKKHKNFLVDFQLKLKDMGIYGASIAVLSFMVEFELAKRAAESQAIRNMSRLCISYAERIRHELVNYMKANDSFVDGDEYEICEMIYDNSTQKIQVLLGYIEREFTKKNPKEISCLIFVERRQTAKCLFYLLKHFCESKNLPIVPEFMVGQTRPIAASIDSWLDSKRQRNVLRKFKRGDCNMMIASSVLEEGIDIQSCNYVIIYDNLKNFGSYVQTKGRARMANSNYVIMIDRTDVPAFIKKIGAWKAIEQKLRSFLVGKTIDRVLPLQEEINEQFRVEIKPYYTKIGSMLEEGSVVALLNRYCMSLPQDLFTSSTVQWFKSTTEDLRIVVRLVLPPQSRIKNDIISDRMTSIKLAKRSAAMKACIQLYEIGELNDHLLPISKVNCFELVEDIYFKHWEQYSEDIPRLAGTGKCKRLHKIQYPHQITAATPKVGTSAYLYRIQITPTFASDKTNEWMIKLLTSNSSYAILCSKEIPQLAKMPMFLTQGKVTCELDPKPIQVILSSDDELNTIRRFHVTLFRDVLSTWNSFFACNYENAENSFCIVPTKNGSEIDWELIQRCQGLVKPRELTEQQRKKLSFNPADYENSVVIPWYSVDQSTRYVVLKVETNMTPFSPFPGGSYENYAAYYNDKYGMKVVVRNQFMLLVQPITSRINTIHPGDGPSGRKMKVRRYDDIKLVPELCHNFRFPGDLWMKSVFLPTFLNRMHYLLLAENIRVSINTFLGIDGGNHDPGVIPVELPNSNVEDSEESIDDQEENEENESTVKLNVHHVEMSAVEVLDSQCKWSEYEEPTDINRKLDNLFDIELDYYMQFINVATEQLSLEESSNATRTLPMQIEAICDGDSRSSSIIQMLGNQSEISQTEILMAITRKSANEVFNMERLELLGDSFLKFGASLYIFNRHGDWNEGCLTALKGRLVSNRNLFYLSNKLDLPGMLNISHFDPKHDWQPPLISVPFRIRNSISKDGLSPYVLFRLNLEDDEVYKGDVNDDNFYQFLNMAMEEQNTESSLVKFLGKQMIGDKCVADSMEAILGVCVKNLSIGCSFKMLNYFGICPKEADKDISLLMNQISHRPRLNPTLPDSEIDAMLTNYKEIEETLGYKFKDRAYLLQALTHPSYLPNRFTGCYQVLEFLGDAVLDFLVSSYIFERCEHMGPGDLTDLRSALVNNAFLACLTVRNKFHLHMLYQSASLMKAIEMFVHFQESHSNKITDQVRVLVEENECSIADYIEVPKALGDVFESLIGAVFLDSGKDLSRTWEVIYNVISEEIAQYVQNVPKQLVRQLTENKGANAKFHPPIVEDNMVMVACQFTCRGKLCEVNGFGQNKESAKISAAKLALQALSR